MTVFFCFLFSNVDTKTVFHPHTHFGLSAKTHKKTKYCCCNMPSEAPIDDEDHTTERALRSEHMLLLEQISVLHEQRVECEAARKRETTELLNRIGTLLPPRHFLRQQMSSWSNPEHKATLSLYDSDGTLNDQRNALVYGGLEATRELARLVALGRRTGQPAGQGVATKADDLRTAHQRASKLDVEWQVLSQKEVMLQDDANNMLDAYRALISKRDELLRRRSELRKEVSKKASPPSAAESDLAVINNSNTSSASDSSKYNSSFVDTATWSANTTSGGLWSATAEALRERRQLLLTEWKALQQLSDRRQLLVSSPTDEKAVFRKLSGQQRLDDMTSPQRIATNSASPLDRLQALRTMGSPLSVEWKVDTEAEQRIRSDMRNIAVMEKFLVRK